MVVDDGGGIGVVVLHVAYLDFLERVACARIAFYLDVHNCFLFMGPTVCVSE